MHFGFVGVSLVALFVSTGITCIWNIEHTIRGIDNRSYYILHAPPPLNGVGHSALAQRTGGNPFYYTMKIIGNDYSSTFNRDTIKAAAEDKDNSAAIKAGRMLLYTLKLRDQKKAKTSKQKQRKLAEKP